MLNAGDPREPRHFRLADDRPGLRPVGGALPVWATVVLTTLIATLLALGVAYALRLRVASAQPACTDGGPWLTTITAQERAGQWAMAANSAATVVNTAGGLCPSARDALERKVIDDGRAALFVDPPQPDDPQGQSRVVDAYRALARQGAQSGLSDLVAPMRVAGPAYNAGEFLLAKTALEDAFTAGAVATTDAGTVDLYYATLRNLGVWYSQGPTPEVRDQGGRYLVTACHLSERLQLAAREACDDANARLGPDRAAWPAGFRTPLDPPAATELGA